MFGFLGQNKRKVNELGFRSTDPHSPLFQGLADPWCRPTSTLNLLLSPATAHLRSASSVHVLDQLDIFFWYQPLPHGSPDLLPRDSVVGLLYVDEGYTDVLLSLSILRYRLLENEGSISGAPSWHEPELAFMDVRALSHPSIQYSLPYLEGVRHKYPPCSQKITRKKLSSRNNWLFIHTRHVTQATHRESIKNNSSPLICTHTTNT